MLEEMALTMQTIGGGLLVVDSLYVSQHSIDFFLKLTNEAAPNVRLISSVRADWFKPLFTKVYKTEVEVPGSFVTLIRSSQDGRKAIQYVSDIKKSVENARSEENENIEQEPNEKEKLDESTEKGKSLVANIYENKTNESDEEQSDDELLNFAPAPPIENENILFDDNSRHIIEDELKEDQNVSRYLRDLPNSRNRQRKKPKYLSDFSFNISDEKDESQCQSSTSTSITMPSEIESEKRSEKIGKNIAQNSIENKKDEEETDIVESFTVTRSKDTKAELKCTYSNAFHLIKKKTPKLREGENLPYLLYNETFNYVDLYNKLMNEKSFKSLHRRGHILLAADDFYFTCLILDAWLIKLSLDSECTMENMSFSKFCEELSQAIFEKYK